jgi:hypothetical protein
MRTLLKIIREIREEEPKIDMFALLTSSIDIQTHVIGNKNYGHMYANYASSISMTKTEGTITLACISDPDVMDFFYKQLRYVPFKLRLYDNIDFYDPDDFEMALNVRSVHHTTDPDWSCDSCAVISSNLRSSYDLYNDADVVYLENTTISFCSYSK